jgi:hypothetical protein
VGANPVKFSSMFNHDNYLEDLANNYLIDDNLKHPSIMFIDMGFLST